MLRSRILSALALFLAVAFAQTALAQSPNVPKYDGDKLMFPDGFRTNWMFVGSNLGLQYKGEGRTLNRAHNRAWVPRRAFHNVYITPEGYAGFRASKTAFPDPTILVIDIYSADPKKSRTRFVAKGFFDGDQQRRARGGEELDTPVRAQAIQIDLVLLRLLRQGHIETGARNSELAQARGQITLCIACHKKNGLVDNVWVQFYPMLQRSA